ncbi:hypothetical protein AC244_33475 [Ensifer adhaerens]|uniref:Uncharacterized protein n=1 Tax=Ensifer adhaerens TaxID=106592 RepID=A0A0L8BD70_ENSAD|nr:hypothetical protein AC244_33475 [Ensifer adhaerens]
MLAHFPPLANGVAKGARTRNGLAFEVVNAEELLSIRTTRASALAIGPIGLHIFFMIVLSLKALPRPFCNLVVAILGRQILQFGHVPAQDQIHSLFVAHQIGFCE